MDGIPAGGLVAQLGLPTVVILLLVGLLLQIVRMVLNRRLVPVEHHKEVVDGLKEHIAERDAAIVEIKGDRDGWRSMSGKLADENAELLTNQDLVLHMLGSIRSDAAVKDDAAAAVRGADS